MCGLADLALVTSLDVPLDIGLERGPPEVVEERAACGIKTLVPQLVVRIVNKGITLRQAGVKLVLAIGLSSPELSTRDEEAAGSADKTGEHITRQVRRSTPRDQISANVG